ncbi:D-mandelate dehydrogenase [Purpureocillium lavendulum]|uniref:D-mandelate dehydrogenase n=1 Tax=Purpureocillium lavendulum TaxID=1247861 RepID=A0AB34FLX8_9HYPO|nr:D-mandelate dehydrogenase [Purpureocillium lavendulum]
MAEPHNTPVPGSTPRATSPVYGLPRHQHQHNHDQQHDQHSQHDHAPPLPPSAPSQASPSQPSAPGPRPRVLHLGDVPRFARGTFDELSARYDVVRPSAEERQRTRFVHALRDGTWGDFVAVSRPGRDTGGEMGDWDAEMVDLLPRSVRVFASAAAAAAGVVVVVVATTTAWWWITGVVYCDGGDIAADAVDAVVTDEKTLAGLEERCMRNVLAVLDGGEPVSSVSLESGGK